MRLLITFSKWKYLGESTQGQLSKDHFAVIHHSAVIHEALSENFHSHSRKDITPGATVTVLCAQLRHKYAFAALL